MLLVMLLVRHKMKGKPAIKITGKAVGAVALGIVGALVLGVGGADAARNHYRHSGDCFRLSALYSCYKKTAEKGGTGNYSVD